MKKLDFDISGIPPTQDAIDAAYKSKKIKRSKDILLFALPLTTIIYAASLFWMFGTNQSEIITTPFLVLVLVNLISIALLYFDHGEINVVISMLITAPLIIIIVMVGYEQSSILKIIHIGAFVVNIFIMLSGLSKLVGSNQNKDLECNTSLDPKTDPDSCLALNQYAEDDEAVRTYLERVAEMGRMPVYGELEAAKAWKEKSKEQTKIREAQQACESWGKSTND